MTVRTRQSYMDLCRSDRPWKGRDMADLVDKIYDVEEKADRASKVNATKLVQAKADGFDVAGEGFLQKREGKWILSEPDFLTVEEANKIYARIRHSHNEYALKRHAPTHHYGGADPLEGQSIHGLRIVDRPMFASVTVDPVADIPTRRTGQIFWDADNHTLSAHLEGSSTTGQFFMEQLIYGQNDSGGAHLNGTVGYIKGSQGQRPTIDTARADDRTKSLAIVFSTEATIASNNSGYYTVRGMTRDIPTGIIPEGGIPWLQVGGGYGPNKPAASINNRNVSLGTVIRSHETSGSVLVDIKCFPFIDELSGVSITSLEANQVLGFNGTYWENIAISVGKLTTPRTIEMTGDGLWSVSFDGSTNVSGAMALASIIAAGGPIGSSTRAPVITYDAKGRLTAVTDALITPAWSNVTSKPTTFSGLGVTMVASDIPNHASRHHYGGADALDGQSISGIRTVDSPSFSGIIILSNGAVGGQVGDNDFWRIKGGSTGSNSGFMEIATADDGTEPIVFRQYTGEFSAIVRTLEILDINGNSIFPGRIRSNGLWSPSIRLTGAASGMVKTDSSGYLSSSALLASELPNHASRHYWDGADPISGQSISGLRTTSSPTFYGIIIGDGGIDLGNLVGIGRNGSGGIYMRPSAGVVRLTVEDTNVYCSTAFSANSGQFTNLSTGFVRSNSVGQLSSSSLLASELPNHASRHHWNGADALAGQSINGLRSTDSPSFLNLNLGGALNFSGYSIITYEGEGFYVETSAGWQLIKSTLAGGTIITAGLFPIGNGIECGKDSYRWNFRSNDLNHDCETITAVNTTPGASILSIPSIGNGFRIVNGSDGSTRNYRVPNGPGAGIMKRIVLFSASVDPTGFTRIYPPSSGQLWNKGYQVTTYIEFGSSAGELKIVMDSDGSNWYI